MSVDVTAPVNWEQLFIQQHETTRALIDKHQELVEILARLTTPAHVDPIQLTANNSVQDFSAEPDSLSVGVLNPLQNPNPIALGVLGSATAPDAIQVAPGGLLVLPIAVGAVQVAAVGAIAGGVTVYGYLLRFKTVQVSVA
jgi:hypothetical protein